MPTTISWFAFDAIPPPPVSQMAGAVALALALVAQPRGVGAVSGDAVVSVPATATLSDGASLPLGSLVHDGPATPEQISLWLPVTGTLASTATAACRYRLTGAGTWVTGHPLYRVRPEFSNAPAVGGPVLDGFAWPIIDVQPGNSYEVEVTVTEGATSVIKTLTHTTRALPPAAGAPNKTAATLSELTTQLAGLNPGDVLQVADGTYTLTSPLALNRSGNSGAPIYIRGQTRGGVILARSTAGTFWQPTADLSDLIIENMTVQGNGVDGGTSNLTTFLAPNSDVWTTSRLTVRNITATGIDKAVFQYQASQALVYDCTFTGNNLWQTSPTNFLGTNLTWNDDGINLAGTGNCAFNNTMTGFGDTFAYAQHSGDDVTYGNIGTHFYRNEIRNSCDDPVEVDHARRNCSWYDNRAHNCVNFESLDPLYGGPWLSARNVMINPYRVGVHKWNDQNTGQFLYNNTYIATVSNGADFANWYQPNNGSQRSYGYRNNLHVYRGAGQAIWIESPGHNVVDWTNNGWYPDRQIQWPSGVYANLAAAQAGLPATTPVFSGSTQRMQNDVITTTNPWTETVTLGASSLTEVTQTYYPVLSAGGSAKNAGVAIPNITDGFSGAAPDMGAVIAGRAAHFYGDRSIVPYALPAPGGVVTFGVNRARDVPPSPLTGAQFDYSLYNSFGAGHYNREYSLMGAYVQACSGGHAHTDFTGGVALDFTDGLFKLHEHDNGGTRQGGLNADGAYFVSQTSGAPYYEITGSGQTPVPGHPYGNNAYLSSANGGGPRGSYLQLGRGALCEAGDIHSRAVHRFDWSTNTWSRVTDNLASRMAYETGVVYDAARGRFWYCTRGGSENDKFIPYLNISDWTFKYDETFPNFPPAQIGGGGRGFLYAGKLFLQAGDGGLIGFDPESGNDPAYVTISGPAGSTLLTPGNKFIYYPRTGKFYQAPRTGGTTLYRLTPPANPITGTWIHDTVTLSSALSVHVSDSSPSGPPGSGLAQHYNALFLVEKLNYLCWVPGGPNYPQMLDPQ